MKIKTRAATIAVVALMIGMIAAPGWAQTDEPEPATLGECLVAFQSGPYAEFLPDDVTNPGEFRAWLEEEGLEYEEACEIGGTYVPEVAGEVVVQPDREEEVIPTPVRRPVEPEVLGEVLAVTGTNAAIFAVVGISLLGLGIVAIRGTRRRPDEA